MYTGRVCEFTGTNCIPSMPAHIYSGTKQSSLNSARMNAGTWLYIHRQSQQRLVPANSDLTVHTKQRGCSNIVYVVGWPNTFCFSLVGCCAAHANKSLPSFFSKQLTTFIWYLPVYIWTCLFKYKHVLNMGYFNHKTHNLWQILSPGFSFTCLLCPHTKNVKKDTIQDIEDCPGHWVFFCFQIKTHGIKVWTWRTQEDIRNN